jgi:GntR family transcriptional regulator, trigonelline degradation regulator
MSDLPSLKLQPGASLRMLAVARIRSEICEGRLAPGTRLVERDLCAVLGVSRTVIREAIRQLEAEGFIAQAPRRGPAVATLDIPTIRAIYEVLGVLEAKAAALFVERASAEEKARIVAINARLQPFADEGDLADGLATFDEFYTALLDGSGNPMFAAILTPLMGRIHMLRVQAALSPERRSAAIRQTDILVRALCGDDPEAAVAAVRARLEDGERHSIAAFRNRFQPA